LTLPGEYFGQIRPALTLVDTSRLINDVAMVEIEADAIADSDHVIGNTSDVAQGVTQRSRRNSGTGGPALRSVAGTGSRARWNT
jgi:hypothetical protein